MRINANSVTWCFVHEKPALLGKTEIEYEKAQPPVSQRVSNALESPVEKKYSTLK